MFKIALLLLSVYAWLVFSMENLADVPCGKVSRKQKIVGGSDANQHEFPWLVSITRRGGHFCGGTLITKKHILTAGHCICSGINNAYLKPGQIKVTLSQHDIRNKEGSGAYEIGVKEIIGHPDYKCAKVRNDIAILELEQEVEWSEAVSPACLPSSVNSVEYEPIENVLATVAGWGWTKENAGNGRANVLQKAQVNILENEQCQEWYKSKGKKTVIKQTQLCAGHETGGVDSCWADSGGPLMTNNDNKMVIVGVVSTGIGCARPLLPGLYTRVAHYIPWIKSEISK